MNCAATYWVHDPAANCVAVGVLPVTAVTAAGAVAECFALLSLMGFAPGAGVKIRIEPVTAKEEGGQAGA